MRIGIVGAGRVGTALAVLLHRAGHEIVGAAGGDATAERVGRFLPGVPFADMVEAARGAEVVLLAVPDLAVLRVCEALANRGAFGAEPAVGHLSGVRSLTDLAAAAAAGCATFSMHPLQSFPTVEAGIERLPGSAVAVTATTAGARELAGRLARDAGGLPFDLADERKPLYHAAAVFAANYVVAVLSQAERLASLAGLEDAPAALLPLTRGVVENVALLGPRGALTGPIARGDAETLAAHLAALRSAAPEAVGAYVALARMTLDLAEAAGHLHPDARRRAEEVLAGWT
jgi:predicted short-subunit dehydrogenase-like oxidoreductase (DUF2520 family)